LLSFPPGVGTEPDTWDNEMNAEPHAIRQDYGGARIHLAWFRNDQERHLLFGLMELVPEELMVSSLPRQEQALCLNTNQFRRKFGDRCDLTIRRFNLSLTEALAWHELGRMKNVLLPLEGWNQNEEAKKSLTTSRWHKDDPPWPNLVTASHLPCYPETVRVHHLWPRELLNQVAKVFADAASLLWLNDRLFFNFIEHPEYQGSLHFVAPNPLFRHLDHTLNPGRPGNKQEGSDIHFVSRKGKTLEELSLIFKEECDSGLIKLQQFNVKNPFISIPHVSTGSRIGLHVVCPQRGVLEMHESTGFIRSIGLEIHVSGKRKKITVPGEGQRKEEELDIPVLESTSQTVIGEPPERSDFHHRRQFAQKERVERQLARELGQVWFHGDPKEAQDHVRNLIGQARNRVWIIDPYFATRELFAFALATQWEDIPVTLLTSTEVLMKPDLILGNREIGRVLHEQSQALNKRIEIKVMTGDPPAIHDRFLVLDEQVWFSGNSLHTLGERASMIIRIPYPGPIIGYLSEILDGSRVKTLSEWVSTRPPES